MIVKLEARSSITLPLEIRRALALEPGAALELTIDRGRLVLTPVDVVPSTYRLTPSGEAKEDEADEDVLTGRVRSYATVAELVEDSGT